MSRGLSEAQWGILQKLADGHTIVYSRDGDCGWISVENKHLADADIWALRNLQYIDKISDERDDNYGDDMISRVGVLALASRLKED